MSADPSGPVDGVNLYVYCSNRPIIKIDPDGRDDVFKVLSDIGKGNENSPYHGQALPVETQIGLGILDLGAKVISLGSDLNDVHAAYNNAGGGAAGLLMGANELNPFTKIVNGATTSYKEGGGGLSGFKNVIVKPVDAVIQGAANTYVEAGEGGKGAQALFNTINPVAAVGEAGINSYYAFKRGDYREGAKQGTGAVVEGFTFGKASAIPLKNGTVGKVLQESKNNRGSIQFSNGIPFKPNPTAYTAMLNSVRPKRPYSLISRGIRQLFCSNFLTESMRRQSLCIV